MTWKSWLDERGLAARRRACRLRPASVFTGSYGIRYRIELANALDRELLRTRGQIDAAVEWCRTTLDSGSVALDIGANAGYWTLPLAQVGRQVIAFEPDHMMRRKLVHNLALNPLLAGRVTVREQAVSETSGQATLHIRRVVDGDALVNTGISSLISSTYLQTDCTVPTLALDDIAGEFDDARTGFIKIDVEGAESLAIRGALRTLRTHAPLLHWEAAYSLDKAASSSNCADTLALLDDCGYAHFAVLYDASTRPICTADDLRDVGYDVNVLSTTVAAQVPPRLRWLGL